jgi:hypothetical protein
MQKTYGNLHTRRAVQRSVIVDDVYSGMDLDREDLLKMRQRDMSPEERIADRAELFMEETDQLDSDWAQMTGWERQKMIEEQERQTRDDIEMGEMVRAENPEFYARCPHPEEHNCGLP